MFLPIFCRCNIIKYIINISLHISFHLWPFSSLSDQTTNQKEVLRAELSCIIRWPVSSVSFGFHIEFLFTVNLIWFYSNYMFSSTIFKRKNKKISLVTSYYIFKFIYKWQQRMMTADDSWLLIIISHYCHEMACRINF